MVFSELLDNVFNLLNNKEEKHHKQEKKALNQLDQGMALLNSRKQIMDKVQHKLSLVESFDSSKLDATNRKEVEILKSMEGEFNEKLSAYSTSYKTFMENYYNAVNQVKNCKSKCLTNYPIGSSAWSYNRQACQAGCELKGPYVQKCQDTFKRSRVNSQNCKAITSGKCRGGNVILGMDNTVKSSRYADSNNISIKDGCCDCGGGVGGPPSLEMRGQKVTQCNQIRTAFGYKRGGHYMTSACLSAPIASPQTNKNLWREYSKLTNQNKDLIKISHKIFDKIKKLKGLDKTLDNDIDDDEAKLKRYLAMYDDVHTKISELKSKKDRTIDGQVEDILLKENSQSFHYFIWTSLAILTILLVVQRTLK